MPWRVVKQFISEATHDCFGELPSNSPRRVVQWILLKLGSMFSSTKTFCFENCIFLTFGLGLCEGVDEDTIYGIVHVDIQVGLCIFLSVFGCHYMCT